MIFIHKKQKFIIEVTDSGILIDDNDKHAVKEKFPRDITDFEIVIDDNDDIHKSRKLQEMLLILEL
jgi:hypothetical protein